MQNELLIAILAGLGAMLGWGFADFFAKKTIDKIGDVTTLFWAQLFGIIPLIALFIFNPEIPHLQDRDLLFLVLLGVWSGLSYIPTYIAFGKGQVSLLSPIFASYAVVVAILSILFLNESIPFNRQLSFIVVFLGVLLISTNPRNLLSLLKGSKIKKSETIKGLPEILLATGLYSVWLIMLGGFINGKNWIPLLLAIRIFSTIALFIYAKATHKDLYKIVDKDSWKFLFLIGFFDVMAFSFVSYGFSATSYISVVAMLSSAFSIPTIILARIFLKEKLNRTQIAGIIIVITGVVFLATV